jgi:CRISPR-associated exonuclease Cas4
MQNSCGNSDMRPRTLSTSGRTAELIHVKDKRFFPISWLQKQDYCEYQIYLENVKGVKVKPSKEMTEGTKGHDQLYTQFAEKALPSTVDEMLNESRAATVFSREFKVVDHDHGIYGLIDEIWMTPDSFIVIDDKPGTRSYLSNIHQIYGYCLAFRTTITGSDCRQVVGALRERGTDNIYWRSSFDEVAEREIIPVVDRIHALLSGSEQFISASNRNKCKVCRFGPQCDRALV